MELLSNQNILDMFAADGLTPERLRALANMGLITRRVPSRVHSDRAEAVWDPITEERATIIRAHLHGLDFLSKRAAAPQHFAQALFDAYRAGKIDGKTNPVGLLGKHKLDLSSLDRGHLARLPLDSLSCLWARYAKKEAKGVPDPEGRTPAYARFTGHVVMSQLAATHPDYATLLIGSDGEPIGARIYPVRKDPSLPLSHENITWDHQDPQPPEFRKRGRRSGVKLTDAQKHDLRAKILHTRRKQAAEFRERWAEDPELRAQFPEEKLPPSLRPQSGVSIVENISENNLNEIPTPASMGYTLLKSEGIRDESAAI